MRYYPVYLDISGRPCTVVGGGAVAERKVGGLLRAGASVTVVSPRVTKGISELAKAGRVVHVRRGYKAGDLAGATLVVCAAGSKKVNRAAQEEAAGLKIQVNVVDDPERCSFIIPSVVDRESLVVAISTSGKSPLLAKTMRKELEAQIGPEYALFVELLGAVRTKLLKNSVDSAKKEKLLAAIIGSPVKGWLAEGERGKVNGFLKGLLGNGFTLGGLGIKLQSRGAARS